MLLVLRAKEKNIICQQKQGERILVFQRVVPLVSTLMCSTIVHKISHKVRIFPREKKKTKGKKRTEKKKERKKKEEEEEEALISNTEFQCNNWRKLLKLGTGHSP